MDTPPPVYVTEAMQGPGIFFTGGHTEAWQKGMTYWELHGLSGKAPRLKPRLWKLLQAVLDTSLNAQNWQPKSKARLREFCLLRLFFFPLALSVSLLSLFLPGNLILVPRNLFPSPHPTQLSKHTKDLLSLEIVKSLPQTLHSSWGPLPAWLERASFKDPDGKQAPFHRVPTWFWMEWVFFPLGHSHLRYNLYLCLQYRLPPPSIKFFEILCTGSFWSPSRSSGGSKRREGTGAEEMGWGETSSGGRPKGLRWWSSG